MPLDPSILMQGQPIQAPNPVSTMTDMLKLGVLSNQLQSGQADAAIKQRTMLGQTQFDQGFPQMIDPLMKGDQGALQTVMGRLAQQYPAAAKMFNDVQFAWQKDQVALRESNAKASNEEAATKQKYAELLGSQANAISQLPNIPPQFITGLAHQASKWGLDGVIHPILSSVTDPNDQAQIKTVLRLLPLAFVKPTEQIAQQNANMSAQNVGSEMQRRADETRLGNVGAAQKAAELQLQNVGVNPGTGEQFQKLPGLAIPGASAPQSQDPQGNFQGIALPDLVAYAGKVADPQERAQVFQAISNQLMQQARGQSGGFTPQKVEPGMAEKAMTTELAKKGADAVGKATDMAGSAATTSAQLDRVESLLKKAYTGGIGGQDWAQRTLNVLPETARNLIADPERMAATQAAQAELRNVALNYMKTLSPSRVTNMEIKYAPLIKGDTSMPLNVLQEMLLNMRQDINNEASAAKQAASYLTQPGNSSGLAGFQPQVNSIPQGGNTSSQLIDSLVNRYRTK